MKQRTAAERGFELRPARAGEAAAIYAVMTAAFSAEYLSYTIFQAPQSVNYLHDLLAQGVSSGHRFTVAADGDTLLGFYYVVARDDELLHPYLAVAPAAQGRGVARACMADYEAVGRAEEFRRLAFDVFASNRDAYAWYLRLGYRVHASSWLVRLPLAELADAAALPLECAAAAGAAAVAEEAARGFSKVDCGCGPGRVTVGLIAGSACKLMAYEGVSLDEAARAIGRRFGGARAVLIVGGLAEVPAAWPVLSRQQVLHCEMVL